MHRQFANHRRWHMENLRDLDIEVVMFDLDLERVNLGRLPVVAFGALLIV